MSEFWETRVSPLMRHLVASLTTLTLCMGILWAFVRPHAEEFIKETVRTENFAAQKSLDAVSALADQMDEQIKALNRSIASQNKVQTRVEADVSILKELQKEQRDDIKLILRTVNGYVQ